MKVSFHPAKFSSHKLFNIGDIMLQFLHVISQDYVSKGYVTLQARVLQDKLSFLQFWWPWAPW